MPLGAFALDPLTLACWLICSLGAVTARSPTKTGLRLTGLDLAGGAWKGARTTAKQGAHSPSSLPFVPPAHRAARVGKAKGLLPGKCVGENAICPGSPGGANADLLHRSRRSVSRNSHPCLGQGKVESDGTPHLILPLGTARKSPQWQPHCPWKEVRSAVAE